MYIIKQFNEYVTSVIFAETSPWQCHAVRIGAASIDAELRRVRSALPLARKVRLKLRKPAVQLELPL